MAAAGAHPSGIVIWDAMSGRTVGRFAGHTDSVRIIAFAPDGRGAASTGNDNQIRVWDAETGQQVRPATPSAPRVAGLVFAPGGQTLITAGHDGYVKLWDAADGTHRATLFGFGMAADFVVVSPDGRWVAASYLAARGEVKVWGREWGRDYAQFRPAGNNVGLMAFSPDSRHLATAVVDGIVRIWPVAALEGQRVAHEDGP